MKKLLFSLAIFSIIILQFSCSSYPCLTKDQFIESYKTFFKHIEKKEDVSDSEAIDDYNKFKDLVNNCYKKYEEELTLTEKQNFWKKTFFGYIKNHNDAVREEFVEDKEFKEYVSEQMAEVVKDSGNDISNALIKAFEKEVPKLLENLSNEFENFGEKFLDQLLDDKKN